MNGRCFYCQQLMGDEHKVDCLLIQKKVKVRMVVEYEIEVPAHWDKGDIEFHRNDGTWCTNNAIDELQSLVVDNDEEISCLCSYAKYKYLGGESAPFLEEK